MTYGILLEPYLTACCGAHLSKDAITRIEGESSRCPVCSEPKLETMLNKYFYRQVMDAMNKIKASVLMSVC